MEKIRRVVIENSFSKSELQSETEDIPKIDVDVFPNPCAELVHLQIPEDCQGAMVTFFDNKGTEVKDNLPKYIPSGTSKISVKHLKKGVYYLKIKTSEFTASDKFIVLK